MSHSFAPIKPDFQPFQNAAATGVTVDPITGAATITGARTVETAVSVVHLHDQVSYIFQAVTADGVGTFKILASNNYDSNRTASAVFADVTSMYGTAPDAVPAAVASANLTTRFAARLFPFAAFKVQYVQASGTTTLNAFLAIKGI